MFVYASRSLLLPSKDHSRVFPLPRGYTGEVPDWAADTDYFQALVREKKIVLPESKRDRDLQTAQEAGEKRKVRRGEKVE